MIDTLPLPGIEDYDKIFWENCSLNKLSIQHCGDCDKPRFPPRHMCPVCQSVSHTWNEVSGDAILWSFVIPRPPLLPVFEDQSPYIVGLVELVEYKNIRLIGQIINIPKNNLDSIEIGDKLRVDFKKIDAEISLPCWIKQ